jgi:hypothetical protein
VALTVIAAVATLVCGAILMPAAELMPATVSSGSWMPGLSPVRSYGLMESIKGMDESLAQTFFHEPNLQTALSKPMHDNIPGEVRSYILYAVFLALALMLAAIAHNAIGRWDSEEKTIIPIKK